AAVIHDPATLDDVHVVGELQREVHVLLDEQDREMRALEAQQLRAEVADQQRREPLGRLVHDEEIGVRHERARDREHLLLAPGELRPTVARALSEPREESEYALAIPALAARCRARTRG